MLKLLRRRNFDQRTAEMQVRRMDYPPGPEVHERFEVPRHERIFQSFNPLGDLASKVRRGAVEFLVHDVRNHADVGSFGKPTRETAGETEAALVVSISECPENGGIEVEAHGSPLACSARTRHFIPVRGLELRVEP
jgi:hypothetical protein